MKWLWWLLGSVVLIGVAILAGMLWTGKIAVAAIGPKADAAGKTDPAGTNQVTKRDDPAGHTKTKTGALALIAGARLSKATGGAHRAALDAVLEDAERTALSSLTDA